MTDLASPTVVLVRIAGVEHVVVVTNCMSPASTSERRTLDPFPARRLVEFAGRRLAVAITEELP